MTATTKRTRTPKATKATTEATPTPKATAPTTAPKANPSPAPRTRRIPQNPCRCGCGALCHRLFRQGHDARMKGWIQRANAAIAPFPPQADAPFARNIGVGGLRLAPLPVDRATKIERATKAAKATKSA